MAIAPGPTPGHSGYTVTPGQPLTRYAWAVIFLETLGIHPNDQNVKAVVAWEQAEGGMTNNSATWNPLNTTQNEDGAKTINSDGVKAYPDFLTGLNASTQTIRNGLYGPILQALQTGTAEQIADAIGASKWGTSGATIRTVLASGPNGNVVLGDPHVDQSTLDKVLTSGPANAVAGGLTGILSTADILTKFLNPKNLFFLLGGLAFLVVGVIVFIKPDLPKQVVDTAKTAGKVAALA